MPRRIACARAPCAPRGRLEARPHESKMALHAKEVGVRNPIGCVQRHDQMIQQNYMMASLGE